MTENLATQLVEENGDPEHVYKMRLGFSTWACAPEHDRYNLDFLYSSRITCFDVCPVILYCFLCAPHFIEMPVTRPIHFVEKTLCPSTICRGTTPPG